MIPLYEHQRKALAKIKNGCILCGGVGSGKSRTSLAYYYIKQGGDVDSNKKMDNPKDLYIITTARKRDTKEWEGEFIPFLIGSDVYSNKVVVNSWNNIKKYANVAASFFIFDEQRVVGYGAWTKSFLNIAKHNDWILLSATPGDVWLDYLPVFIANGFYRNKTEFTQRHVIYKPYIKYPAVQRYVDEGILIKYRKQILVQMPMERKTEQHHEDIFVDYDKRKYQDICKFRWNPYTDEPIKNAGEFCYTLRHVVNESPGRQLALLELVEEHPRVIIFYNYDYELEILRNLGYGVDYEIAEWNGHSHQPIPNSNKWVYLVQYTAGAEGWNCVSTDTVIFYSQNYSYKIMVQSAGRIDRLNTTYRDLYYYHLKSRSGIDISIARALKKKKKFNENDFYKNK